jgi:signal transduction histidine kinase
VEKTKDEKNQYENAREEIAFLSHKILDLNKQLIESEKAKSHFLSLVASELNNPMTGLLGMIPHLKPEGNGRLEAIFELVHEEALLLNSRIQNLVAVAEIESGEMDVTYASVDPKTLVEEAIKAFKYKLKNKNITVIVESALRDTIVSDPKKLYLILKNLLANACDYGDAGAVVYVDIEQKGSVVTIAVKNQGKGPNVEYKPQVFTRFAHGMEGLHGLGLGLSISRELCEGMDGSIDYVASDGSVTFTVTLPLETALPDSQACGSDEFLFESFDGAIEL